MASFFTMKIKENLVGTIFICLRHMLPIVLSVYAVRSLMSGAKPNTTRVVNWLSTVIPGLITICHFAYTSGFSVNLSRGAFITTNYLSNLDLGFFPR